MKENLAQWLLLSLKKARTPQNIKVGFKAIRILFLDKDRMCAKMELSEGFNQKALDIQIREILEELVPPLKENVVHYYLDIEGESPRFPPPNSSTKTSFSQMLRLFQQKIKNPKMRAEP
jgi:hypothetical protein